MGNRSSVGLYFSTEWGHVCIYVMAQRAVLNTWYRPLSGQLQHAHRSPPASGSRAYAPSATPWSDRREILVFEHAHIETHTQSKREVGGLHWLVALVLEVFAIAVVQKQCVWVVLANPLHLLNIKSALGLDPFSLSASWNRNGQA